MTIKFLAKLDGSDHIDVSTYADDGSAEYTALLADGYVVYVEPDFSTLLQPEWTGAAWIEGYNPTGYDLYLVKLERIAAIRQAANKLTASVLSSDPTEAQRLAFQSSLVDKYNATTASATDTLVMTAMATAMGMSLADWVTFVELRIETTNIALGQIESNAFTGVTAVQAATTYANVATAYTDAIASLGSDLLTFGVLNFLSADWDNECGVIVGANPGNRTWVWNGPNDLSYDAEDPQTPTFGGTVMNAKASLYGDARVTGYVDPVTTMDQGQMQVALSAQTGETYVAICVWVGVAAGNCYVYKMNGGATLLGSSAIPAAADVTGVWIKATNDGANTRVRVWTKDSGVWTAHGMDYTDATPIAALMKPGFVFNSDSGNTVTDAQVYHANKFEFTSDGSLA